MDGKVLLHIGICWQIWVVDERATNERARNLKVGFYVDQLGIAAAETVGFSLQKVSSSFSSFFVNRDNSCSGGLPNYLHQHNLRDLIPRWHLKIAFKCYLCDEVRANLLKDLELVLRCRFWWARVFAVESLVCKSFVTTKSLKYQRRQIPIMLGICWQVINCDIRSLSRLYNLLGALKSISISPETNSHHVGNWLAGHKLWRKIIIKIIG